MPPIVIAILLTAASAAVFVAAFVGFTTSNTSPSARRAIVAQYAPPVGVAVLAAAVITGEQRRAVSAQLVDLTVRRAIAVRAPEVPAGPYRLELLRFADLSGVELATVQAVFGRRPSVGTIVPVNSRNSLLQRRLGWAQAQGAAWVAGEQLSVDSKKGWRLLLPFAQLLLVPITIGMSELSVPLVAAATTFGLGTLAFTFGRYSALTASGADLRDQLAGLRLFIRQAEADRMRVLQGPDTALRSADIILLTERLLGWAVLFGYGRQWAAILEQLGSGGETRLEPSADLTLLLAFSASFDGVATVGALGELPPDDALVSDGGALDFGTAGGNWDGSSDGNSGGDAGDGGGGSGGGDGGGGGGD